MRTLNLPLVIPVLSAFSCLAISAAPVLQNGDYVAICGDSITEQKIYSSYIEEYLIACQPAAKLQASQFGWGGETSWGFQERMENEVLGFKPSVATVCYGMNDADYSKTKPERLAQYTAALTDVVKKFKSAGVRQVIIGSPGAVDSTSFKGALFRPVSPEDYNKTLSDFSEAAQKVAQAQNVVFADLHTAAMKTMAAMKEKYGNDYLLFGDDGIHPKEAGHLVMTYAFLKAMGCEGNIGTIALDMGSGKAVASEGHKIISATNHSIEIESSRYPFCFSGKPSKPDATSGVIEFLPFNQDLNRLMLVVRNAPQDPVTVNWGGETKTFPAAQLAKGINLAAEFLNNPFVAPFKNVHEAVLRQQRFETPMVKEMIHSIPQMKKDFVSKDVPLDALKSNLIAVDRALRQSTAASVVPIRHEIRIGN